MNNPPLIDSIEWKNITPVGEAKLAAFPEQALAWAAGRMHKHKEKKEPFSYFVKLCKIYCQDYGIDVDISLTQSLISKQNLDPWGPSLSGPLLKPLPLTYTTSKTLPKEGRERKLVYEQAMERYKASKQADNVIHRKQFKDITDEKEILKQIAFFENPPNMPIMIGLLGEQAAWDYVGRIKQNWLDKLAAIHVNSYEDEIQQTINE